MSVNERPPTDRTQADWVQQPVSALLWWCLPLTLAFAINLFALPQPVTALVWALAFAWMGMGCLLNARRCHRLHCYISGPAFFLGAIVIGLLGSGVLALGQHAINNAVGFTLAAALLSFVPEIVWRKYA